jgi:hypothetical protein
MSVIKHDFGSDDRRAARRLRTLLELGALHEANIRSNPPPYLERASERIFQLEKILFEAVEAATFQSASPVSSEMISVRKGRTRSLFRLPCDHREWIGKAGLGHR